MSTTMTIRLEDDVEERLERLAETTQRSKSFPAAEAIRSFVENNEWQVAEITDDVRGARVVVERVLNAIDLLQEQPGIGRPGRIPGTRELVVPKTGYLVPYRVRGDTVEVLRVLHTSRRPPKRW